MPGLYEKTKARTSIHDTIIDTKIQESVKIKAGSKRKSEEVNGNLKLFVAVKKKKLYNRTMDKKIKTENTETIRINKYLSNAGVCSRRDADQFTDAGRVTLDGTAIKTGERIPIDAVVCLDGHPITKEEKKVLLLFYKPRGIVCSTKKQRNETTVTEYLDYPLRVYPVGRLDKDSEGLLLLTNQGDLVNRIMRAGNYHEKEYLVTVNKEITEDFLKGMRGGVPILDTVTRPCTVKKTGRRSFQIILTQGLNRQIRRMCEYFGYQVQTLKRVRIMNLTLDGLDPGEYRDIRRAEEWKELEKQDPEFIQRNDQRDRRTSMETAAVNQMKELVKKLNEAAKAYYQEDREIMSNREYDALYDQLEQAWKQKQASFWQIVRLLM